MRAFEYERPTRLDDAIAMLAEHGPKARLLAGGTDLIIRLRDGTIGRGRRRRQARAELDGDPRTRRRRCASAPDHDRDRRGPPIRTRAALAEAALVVGSVQIRNRATLAGNICNASPAADTLPALLVYGARVEVAGPDGTRGVPLDDVSSVPGSRPSAGRARDRHRPAAANHSGEEPSIFDGPVAAATTSRR